MIVGYARVSTDGQTLLAQQASLTEAGCARVFAEKQSGAKTDRAQLAKAIAGYADRDQARQTGQINSRPWILF
jgi:DNA invertase Pin-like site-specific DNA recombinase